MNNNKPDSQPVKDELLEHARLLEERNAELRRLNEELKKADQTKSDLISMVSHELRTPLATIKEFTGILTDKIAGPVTADQQEYLAIIQGNVERLARIIDDLLDMAKLEGGHLLLNKGMTEVAPLLKQVLQSLQPLADSKQIVLDLHLPESVPSIFADADKVTQVLTNLIGNAIKFTEASGRITVSVVAEPNEVRLDVTDTGVGIAPEDLPKLFEKFQQLRRMPGASGGKGTGLGLAISKRLVELHGGRIWATSTVGTGSTFSFTVPKYHVEEVFREYIRTGIEHAKRKHSCFSVILATIPTFPQLKALHGLEEMSRLLKMLEALLQETVRHRAGDVVIHWQRGEMVVVISEVDKPGAQAIAQRITRMVHDRTFTIGGQPITLSLVTSIATYPDEAITDDELLRLIETRLQRVEQSQTAILVVDDEPKIRQFLSEVLALREYEVLTAASGQDALTQLKRQRVDLILLDVMMPDMDGYELYHLIKENPQTKDTPVIMVTAKGERKDRQLGVESAPYNYVMKPFQLEDLVAKIQQVLQQRTRGV